MSVLLNGKNTNANIAEKSNKRKIEKCQSKFTQRNKRTIKNEIIRTKPQNIVQIYHYKNFDIKRAILNKNQLN